MGNIEIRAMCPHKGVVTEMALGVVWHMLQLHNEPPLQNSGQFFFSFSCCTGCFQCLFCAHYYILWESLYCSCCCLIFVHCRCCMWLEVAWNGWQSEFPEKDMSAFYWMFHYFWSIHWCGVFQMHFSPMWYLSSCTAETCGRPLSVF